MHELALAEAVIAVAEQHAGGRRVARVELRIGRLRQVVHESLAFSFQIAGQGTLVDGAELAIDDVPVRVRCRTCSGYGEAPRLPLACPGCGGLDVEVTSGEEFHVVALELDEEPVLPTGEVCGGSQ